MPPSEPRRGDQTADLVRAVHGSAKYRRIAPELIAAIGARELRAHGNLKDAIKATKNTLHQVYGAFFAAPPRYDAWLDHLDAAADQGPEQWREACLGIMRNHSSTRERAPVLSRFYAECLAGLPPIHSVLDLGCGLNPLSIPWMNLPPDVTYYCCDIDAGLVDFLNRFFGLAGIRGQAEVRDLTRDPPRQPADLALALKLLPTLETLERGASAALPRALEATHLLVSFPERSLGGRRAGMARGHGAAFRALADQEGWMVEERVFPGETVFLATGKETKPV
ncbi:MAG: 16S rRNA methyltransferase [Chloroflexota bacterium]